MAQTPVAVGRIELLLLTLRAGRDRLSELSRYPSTACGISHAVGLAIAQIEAHQVGKDRRERGLCRGKRPFLSEPYNFHTGQVGGEDGFDNVEDGL